MTSDERYENIPHELKELRQWVCYRIEKRDGKKTKIPYRTDKVGRGRAKTNDPTTWHTFEEVVEAVGKPKNRFDGVGFVLSETDPYVFIDLDHVVNDGKIEGWAQEIIEKMHSYTEFSQSGGGIHIIVRAKKPGPRCRTHEHPKFEIYDSVRLVVFTGNLVSGSQAEIMDAQRMVDEVYFGVFGENPRNAPPKETTKNLRPVGMSDPALIEKAMSAANAGKFRRLWNGNTGDYDGDDSAADMALCCMLVFWTQRDPARIDRMFRESGLMRSKWDEKRGDQTYGEMTIDAAIEQTTDVYRGPSDRPGKREVTEEELASARERIGKAKEARTAAAVFEAVESLAILSSGEYADVVKELKEKVPQLDLRELKSAVGRAGKSKRAGDSGAFPELVVNNRQLRDMGNEAIRLLEHSNVPPTLFVRSGVVCQVVEDECGRPVIRTVTDEIIVARLAKTCDFVVETKDGPKNVVPPRSIASYVLSEGRWPFPALEAITRSPTIRRDGSIAQLPGYDPETRLFYYKLGQDETIEVPETPQLGDVRQALDLIDELLHDFPFDCPASRANALALLLSPVVQPAIMDVAPLVLIDAPTAGSGKGLLATVAGIISGGTAPDFTTAPTRDEEWPKKITAILFSGPSLVVIDNVKYTLQSADLAALLTAKTWKDRVFGKNTETVILPNRATWVATGNNIQLGGDIPRRCIWIRIDPRQPKPHERKDFLHSNLTLWVSENRGRLLSALLTLCRAWYAAECPAYPAPAFGSFETWTRTVGGILAHAGVTGFLENKDRLWEQSDTESTEWEVFLSSWLELYGSTPVTPKELVRNIEAEEGIAEAVPVSISDAVHGKGDSCSRIGYQFRARLGKRYGPRGLRLERGPRKGAGITWTVAIDEYQSECRVDDKPYTDSVSELRANEAISVGCVGLQTPNVGAEEKISQREEIIPCETGLNDENPTQPYTLHASYVCRKPGCGRRVQLAISSEHWHFANYYCVCGHRGVVTRQDYKHWLVRQSAPPLESSGDCYKR